MSLVVVATALPFRAETVPLGVVPSAILLPALAAILVVSAWKVWGHARDPQ